MLPKTDEWPLNIFDSEGPSPQHSQMATRADEFPGLTTDSRPVWTCALHGTVHACPFVYMTCEGTDLSGEDLERTGGEYLHRQSGGDWQGFKNEHRQWNDGAEAHA